MFGRDNGPKEPGGEAPTIEERLRAVHVIPPQRLTGKIVIAPYSAEWPQRYATEAGAIRAALGERALVLEHVGSTSVPGLAAKPIIDIVLEVPDPADEPAYVPALEAVGYALHVREPDWFQHRLLKPADLGVHLHVFGPQCEETQRMLVFRDHLRRDAADRALYERTKRELAQRDWTYRQEYADAKSAVVREIMARAVSAPSGE